MKIFIIFFLLNGISAELDTTWWKHTSIYELMVQSFKDSDGDGIGDFKGIISKLDHFVDLGIETIYLTPFYKSPMLDIGYDVSDYYNIHPPYGTMADFEQLVKEMNARGMKLLIDLVINHSSDQHQWFQNSVKKIEPYIDYYVWVNPKGFDNTTHEPIPPNDWMACFGGSAWKWNSKRGQFYYHVFLDKQPDLNLRNEVVKQEVKKILKFWLDKGIAGFRLDAPFCYVEPENLNAKHPFSAFEESIEVIHEMRLFLDTYNRQYGGIERIFVPETVLSHLLAGMFYRQYYGTKTYPVTQLPLNHYFGSKYIGNDASEDHIYLESWLRFISTGNTNAWQSQSHDVPRTGSRVGPEYDDIFTTMTVMLPGSVSIYYGQEIAMRNGYIREDQHQDKFGLGSRDPCRLIMQWDDSLNAGFSTNTKNTYLPSNSDYYERNVANQKNQQRSHYNLMKTLLALRKTDTLKYGDFQSNVYRKYIFVFWRSYNRNETYIVVVNFNKLSSHVNIRNLIEETPSTLTVVATSINSEYKKGDKIRNNFTHQFIMRPLSCIILSTGNIVI